jgi:hypothetical protein
MEENFKLYFETVYKEYKDYESFVLSIKDKVIQDRDGFAKFAQENSEDVDKIVDKIVEINENPILHENDLMRLQMKLVNTYDVIKEIVEIPQEIKEETEKLRFQQVFKIEDNKAIPINQDKLNTMRERTKAGARDFLTNLMKG